MIFIGFLDDFHKISFLFCCFFYQTAFNEQNDFGKEARKAAWATEQRTIHGLQSIETKTVGERHTFGDISGMAEEAKRRAEIARLVSSSNPFGQTKFNS